MQTRFYHLKIVTITLGMGLSLNTLAFLDFNNYQSGYDDNDWPVWTPMYWMEEAFGNNNKYRRHQSYPYPYNNKPYNINAQHFNMQQMPTPGQAYWMENSQSQTPVQFDTPAAMSFSQDHSTTNRTPNSRANSRGF